MVTPGAKRDRPDAELDAEGGREDNEMGLLTSGMAMVASMAIPQDGHRGLVSGTFVLQDGHSIMLRA